MQINFIGLHFVAYLSHYTGWPKKVSHCQMIKKPY